MLISAEQLPGWAPGRLILASPEDGPPGVAVRSYAYPASEVDIPAVRDHLIVAYRRGTTTMRRCLGGAWQDAVLRPGDVSLLSSGVPAHWEWSSEIEVVQVFLGAPELEAICRDVYDREVAEIELDDALRADDPHLFRVCMMLASEVGAARPGGKLIIDALVLQLGVHLLRKHAGVAFREPRQTGALSAKQQQDVLDYVRGNMHGNLGLDNLARAAGVSRYHFARQFRATFGATTHAFVLEQRLARAREMLRRSTMPLTDIAAACGFADASHLIRVFKRKHQMTPGRYRSGGEG